MSTRATTHRPSFKIQNKPGRQWSSAISVFVRTVARVRASERQTFLNEGNPAALPRPLPLHTKCARTLFYELVKLCVFFIYAGPKRRSNDTRPIEKLPRDLTSAAGTQAVPMIFVSSFFPPSLPLLFRFVERGRNTVTSRLLFRKIYNWPFTTSVKIHRADV